MPASTCTAPSTPSASVSAPASWRARDQRGCAGSIRARPHSAKPRAVLKTIATRPGEICTSTGERISQPVITVNPNSPSKPPINCRNCNKFTMVPFSQIRQACGGVPYLIGARLKHQGGLWHRRRFWRPKARRQLRTLPNSQAKRPGISFITASPPAPFPLSARCPLTSGACREHYPIAGYRARPADRFQP